MVYNAYLSPLSRVPGPKYMAASIVWYMYSVASGKHHTHCYELHRKYGPVVRFGPNQLSFSTASAYKQIYGHRSGKLEMTKDPLFYGVLPKSNLISSNVADHARIRRLLAHAFSDRALREQEDLIQKYVSLLISRLTNVAAEGRLAGMVSWYNFTTFDIIGDLAFGEPFDCLESSELHPWVRSIFAGVKAGAFIGAARFWPSLSNLLNKLISKKLIEMRENHKVLSAEKVRRRLQQKTDRMDFTTYILRHNDEKGMSVEEIEANADLLILAGSETTATLLSGCTYQLLTNPQTLEKLKREVRSTFQSEDEITIQRVSHLDYTLAVIEESLRMYPPVPIGLPRLVPDGGEDIEGIWVPGGVSHCFCYQSLESGTEL